MRKIVIIIILIIMSVVTKVTNAIGFSSLKKEQEKVINEFIAGKDVFVCLPTVPTHKSLTFDVVLLQTSSVSRHQVKIL